jgi:hypothetical protein
MPRGSAAGSTGAGVALTAGGGVAVGSVAARDAAGAAAGAGFWTAVGRVLPGDDNDFSSWSSLA